MAVAPQITQAYDDVDPRTGTVYYGDYTNDTAPLVRVTLGDQAVEGDTVFLRDNGSAIGPTLSLTADELHQGYVDIQISGLAPGWNLLTAVVAGTDSGVIASSTSWALGVATAAPAAPEIRGAIDDAGPVTGAVADGGHTDDATPTIRIYETGLPPTPTSSPGHAPYGGEAIFGGSAKLYEGGVLLGEARLGYDGEVTITPAALSAGEHTLTVVAVDRAGNVSAASTFHLTVEPDPAPDPSPTPTVSAPATDDQVLQAAAGGAELHGDAGDDTLTGTDGHDVLRGDEGNDSLVGGAGFDDTHGNVGDDTVHGGLGGDWVVGGQGADQLFGDEGDDIVYGNLGSDTCDGGDGSDIVRGGQADDVLIGGAGDDWLSGDRGDDTITGGAGADTFHGSAAGEIDRITDFNRAEGDRVLLDAGTAYHVDQVGADTVVTIGGQSQMILVGVQSASLGSGWLIEA